MSISRKAKKKSVGDCPHLPQELIEYLGVRNLLTLIIFSTLFVASFQARNNELVIRFSGITMVAEPNVMLASPMYVEDKTVSKEQEDSAGKGVSVAGVASIAVFCTLAVVAVALVTFKVSAFYSFGAQTFRARCKS